MNTALQARIRIVQSPSNRWVKSLRAALLRPPALLPTQSAPAPIALEGFHLLVEALRSGIIPTAIFLRAGEEDAALETLGSLLARYETSADPRLCIPSLSHACEFLVLPPALFAAVTGTEVPQPIAALIAVPNHSLVQALQAPSPLLLVLAGLQDPGNLGTLLRSAEAFGATGALLLPGTTTPWSGKALRASAGTALRLPLVAVGSVAEAAQLLRKHRIRSVAAVAAGPGATAPEALPLLEPSAFWIGNEGAGLSKAELAACDTRVTIPMPGLVESLNAAVAGSLLLYEASRQRTRAANP